MYMINNEENKKECIKIGAINNTLHIFEKNKLHPFCRSLECLCCITVKANFIFVPGELQILFHIVHKKEQDL